VGSSDFSLGAGLISVWFGPALYGFQFINQTDGFALEALLLSTTPFLTDGALRETDFPIGLFDWNATLTLDSPDFSSWTALGFADGYDAGPVSDSAIPEPSAYGWLAGVGLLAGLLLRTFSRGAGGSPRWAI
jgi:hypothetical protein